MAKNKKEKKFTEAELIELLDEEEIGFVEFIEGLQKVNRRAKSNVYGQWILIRKTLRKKRKVRNTDFLPIAAELGANGKVSRTKKLNIIRGILAKFREWGGLVAFRDGDHTSYLCNWPAFYRDSEIINLVSQKDRHRILKEFETGSKRIDQIEEAVEHLADAYYIIQTIAKYYVEQKVLVAVGKKEDDAFRLTPAAKITGTDPVSLEALGLFQAQNLLEEKRNRRARLAKPKSVAELAKLVAKDNEEKMVKPRDLVLHKPSIRFMTIGEARLGNQATDFNLLLYAQQEMKKINPDFVVGSGFAQGDFKSHQVNRLRALTPVADLDHIASQFKHADMVLKEFEENITKDKLYYILSDDDMNVAYSRAILAMRDLLGLRRAGYEGMPLWTELISRLAGRDYVDYFRTQWEYVQPYMWRIGRSLLNKEEVDSVAPGLNKNEFLVILMTLLFKECGHEIPDEFKALVDVEALFGDKAKSKRSVTPDPLLLKWVYGDKPDDNILFHFIHNAAYSDVTQYVNSLENLEKMVRHMQARRKEVADFIFDFQQENFFLTYVGNSFVGNLPGCQDNTPTASLRSKTFSTRIVGEKSHKQNTFRKEATTPGVCDFEVIHGDDHKISALKIRILNESTKRIINNNKTMPEVKERLAVFQDIQVGSPTMRLEWTILAHDFALWGPNPVHHVAYNGDIVHGQVYPQFYSESRIKKLISIKSQQAAAEAVMLPFYPAPSVKMVQSVLGNHEWDNKGSKFEGMDPLSFLTGGIGQKYRMLQQQGQYKDVIVRPRSRNRMINSGHPGGGGTVHWPYFTERIGGGYLYAVQHKWQLWGGGKSPVDKHIAWMLNMARSAQEIDVTIGGHFHSLWLRSYAGKLLTQLPGLNDQSGYELGFGYCPKSMFAIFEFSNRDGITLELYTPEFLENHKLVCPEFKGIDAELVRPKKGTREYKYGLDSPYIYNLLDEIDAEHVETE